MPKRKPTRYGARNIPRRSKLPNRTLQEKLKVVIGVSVGFGRVYTQKEIAELTGISVRTLRRIKNIPGYKASDWLLNRNKDKINRQEKSFSAAIIRRAKKEKTPIVKTKIVIAPKVYKAKNSGILTYAYSLDQLSLEEKIRFCIDHLRQNRKLWSWRATVEVPVGVSVSGRSREDGALNGDVEAGEDGDDKPEKIRYMIGPFAIERGIKTDYVWRIRKEFGFHENAGRRIITVYFTEKGKP